MAGEATAVVFFSHRSVFEELKGPAYSRLWRPGYACVLIEKHVPVWVVSPVGYAADDEPRKIIVDCNEDLNAPVEMNLFPTMASLFNQENHDLRKQGEREGLINTADTCWWIAPRYFSGAVHEEIEQGEVVDRISKSSVQFPSGRLLEMSVEVVAKECRVSSMRFPRSYVGSHNPIIWMRSQGIDVDEFTLTVSGYSEKN